MMTNLQVFTDLWDWNSPAWWVALAATVAYGIGAGRRNVSGRQVGFFVASAALFLVALVSPLATLASRYLFSAHMAQHLLLLLIVPLCAILAWPSLRQRAATPLRARPYPLSAVALGWAAGVGAMWFWHVPAMCTASMRIPLVFGVQVVSLVAAGAAFWLPVFAPDAGRRLQPLSAAAYLFSGCVGCSLLGVYVTFSPVAVCPLYAAPAGSPELVSLVRHQWGLTHRIDQQLGGLLMWVPACMIYLGAILATFSSWYQVPGRSSAASPYLATE
jgi:cytochrome c oxidase assembly factor CtaG